MHAYTHIRGWMVFDMVFNVLEVFGDVLNVLDDVYLNQINLFNC